MREISIAALIITVMLACILTLPSQVFAPYPPGSLIWKKFSNPSSAGDVARGVAVDGTGVYIVGHDYKLGDARWRIEKRDLTSGSLTWVKTSNPSSSGDFARGAAVDSSGVYIVGFDDKPGNYRWRVEKRDPATGSLTWVKTSNPSSEIDEAYGVAVDDTGVYIVGYDSAPGTTDTRWRIEKRDPADGSLTWKKTSNPSSGYDKSYGVAVYGTGVYIVGYDEKPGNGRWRMEKRSTTDGSLLWKKTSNPSSGFDWAYGVAVDSTGVYIVGHDYKPENMRWRIEKRDPADGNLIWKKTSNPSSYGDVAYGVAVDSTYVYVVGYDSKPGNWRWRIEKRGLTSGSLTWTKTSNPSSNGDVASGVAVDGSGVYIVGYDGKPSIGTRWRMEKRHV